MEAYKGRSALIPDLTLSSEENAILATINMTLNVISIISAFTVIVVVVAIRLYDKRLIDRVSLRLNAAISATDLVRSVSLLIYTLASGSRRDTGEVSVFVSPHACAFAAFLLVWLSNQYLFLTAAIAYNLRYLFLQHHPFQPGMEKWYYIVSILASLILAAIPWAAGRFGYDMAQQYCWYTPSYAPVSQIWESFTFLGPVIASLVYCTVIVCLVAWRIWSENRQLDVIMTAAHCENALHLDGITYTNDKDAEEARSECVVARVKRIFRRLSSKYSSRAFSVNIPDIDPFAQHQYNRRLTKKIINQSVRRILLYVIIPLVTQLGFLVSEIWMYARDEASFGLNVWSVITNGLPGTLNLAAFVVDPAVIAAWATIRQDLILEYAPPVPEKKTSYQHLAGSFPNSHRRDEEPTLHPYAVTNELSDLSNNTSQLSRTVTEHSEDSRPRKRRISTRENTEGEPIPQPDLSHLTIDINQGTILPSRHPSSPVSHPTPASQGHLSPLNSPSSMTVTGLRRPSLNPSSTCRHSHRTYDDDTSLQARFLRFIVRNFLYSKKDAQAQAALASSTGQVRPSFAFPQHDPTRLSVGRPGSFLRQSVDLGQPASRRASGERSMDLRAVLKQIDGPEADS
ncbi:hypothetical protein BZG36_01020 [Bifiguratus adelaidae]|uniref:G-protein coupled receptors family 2 profile 2 domain-containing protein n=1 Tax=Bifiguratus adelaidae TaxID=1938954 RepID=A0A261Y6F2_9FUNG|nr:hypothetical protein BZG36_01020 [Bifiguratus adelaidae]